MSPVVRAQPAGQVLSSGVKARAKTTEYRSQPFSRAEIVARLEHAGMTLLALPTKGYSTHLRQMRFDIVHTALEAYGWEIPALRAPAPSASAISEMDETFSWLALIPEQSFLLRRVLNARALVHPLTNRHLFPWRRLAAAVGADHKSVQRWHARGVAIIEEGLNGYVASQS